REGRRARSPAPAARLGAPPRPAPAPPRRATHRAAPGRSPRPATPRPRSRTPRPRRTPCRAPPPPRPPTPRPAHRPRRATRRRFHAALLGLTASRAPLPCRCRAMGPIAKRWEGEGGSMPSTLSLQPSHRPPLRLEPLLPHRLLPRIVVAVEHRAHLRRDLASLGALAYPVMMEPVVGAQRVERLHQRPDAVFERHAGDLGMGQGVLEPAEPVAHHIGRARRPERGRGDLAPPLARAGEPLALRPVDDDALAMP